MTSSSLAAVLFVAGVGPLVCCGRGSVVRPSERPAAVRPTPGDGYDESLALVIGVGTSAVGALPSAIEDAERVGSALRARNFNVVATLTNPQDTTRTSITEWLGDKLPTAARQANSRVFIFFAGHSKTSTGTGQRQAYLIASDSDPSRLNSTALSMQTLKEWTDDYSAKHVLFVADTCYAGALAAPLGTGRADSTVRLAERVRAYLAAGGADERANYDDRGGFFTSAFLRALEVGDQDFDGYITVDEIAAFVAPLVQSRARKERQARQTPTLEVNGSGTFVFGSLGGWWPPPPAQGE